MKRILAVVLVLSMLFALCTVSASAAGKEKKVTFSLGTTSSAEDWQTKACEHFAELVNERTDGQITINVFPASQLGDANTEMESMITGGQDMFMEVELNYLYNYGIEDLATNTFGVVNTKEALTNLLHSDLMAEYRETFRQKNGIVTLSGDFVRQQATLCFKERLTSIEQFKGIKLRTVPSEAAIAAYSALGFNPTSVSFNEVYLSLSQGVIDGAAAALDAQYTMKFYEQAPYILDFGTDVSNVALWMNEAKFSALSENQQQILLDAAQESAEWYTENAAAAVAGYVKEMEAAGAEVIEPDEAFVVECMELFKQAAYEFEKAGKMPEGAFDKVYAAAHPEG